MKRLVPLVVALVVLVAPVRAGAAIYWGHDDFIGVANLDGSQRSDKINPELRGAWGFGLAVDATHLYYDVDTNESSIGRASIDGSNADSHFIGGLDFPSGLALDGSHIYWADRAADVVGRANLDGTDVEREFIKGADYPCGVALDDSYVYWTNLDSGTIGRARLDGTGVEPEFITGVARPCGLAVTSSAIYWTSLEGGAFDPGSIGRAPIAGGSPENRFIPDIYEAFSLAANDTHLFWTDEGWENSPGDPTAGEPAAVGRARLDGTEVERRWIGTVLAHGVAVDSRVLTPAPPPGPLPSQPISFGQVRHDRKTGTAVLDVFVPARGELALTSPGIGWRVIKGPEPPSYRVGSFRWRLKLWPGKSRLGEKIRTRLHKHGRTVLNLKLSYTEEGRLPAAAERRLALLQHRKS